MTIIITDRWGNETKNPSRSVLDKTINDVFLDSTLPDILSDISITDGVFHFDINKNRWVYLEDSENQYYMKELEVEKIRELWKYFYEGNVDYILAEPWIEGIPAFNGDW
jgi:hypothetical protein